MTAVCFPSASALAASFDREELKELGSCLGEECQAEQVGMLLGPGLNMKRSPLCGRNFEYFSEDPYLTGELAASYVRSIQEKGVAACAKHFACNNQETNRLSGSLQVDERTLRELYLEMPGGSGAQDTKIVKAVQEGRLDEKLLDQVVERMLTFIMDCENQRIGTAWNYERDHQKAVEIAENCMVLLENRESILPLKKEGKIAFIGEFARAPRYQGGGSSHVNSWKVTDAFHCAKEAREAEAHILFGEVCPSGKLAETFPLKLSDNPSYLNFPGEEGVVQYKEDIFIGYRYYDKKQMDVAYPFGYGLSYTSFAYGELHLDKESMKDTDTLSVSCRVTNTGAVPGKETVQLYTGQKGSCVRRPIRELKGFEKVELKSGESKIVTFSLDKRSFTYYNTKIADWYVPDGEYSIQIGASSRDIRLEGAVWLESTTVFPVEYTKSMTVGKLAEAEPGRQFIVKALMKFMQLTEMEIEEQPDVAECPESIEQTIQNTMLGMLLTSLVTYGAVREEQLEAFLDRRAQ
ncbi:fibronectin type III-like domain-contianing protein [Lachnospiraceae bacterium 29-91]